MAGPWWWRPSATTALAQELARHWSARGGGAGQGRNREVPLATLRVRGPQGRTRCSAARMALDHHGAFWTTEPRPPLLELKPGDQGPCGGAHRHHAHYQGPLPPWALGRTTASPWCAACRPWTTSRSWTANSASRYPRRWPPRSGGRMHGREVQFSMTKKGASPLRSWSCFGGAAPPGPRCGAMGLAPGSCLVLEGGGAGPDGGGLGPAASRGRDHQRRAAHPAAPPGGPGRPWCASSKAERMSSHS